ncbi:AraC family transcriptional regulator [Tianweitania sp. BSSL-BM11]|uniref:AraC family transcriptional regulator n=1 Tax=Tianweitania aestuarii TaxID=2814886 RepID=A0ABS5RYJ6_9HYPH|nr:AraC family transcriptional regulator [Tianweitania aestuarii]MBS9721397.1 AraC family transcriptional regulator [Tianweitania aestuarii]
MTQAGCFYQLSPSLDAFQATMSGLLRPCRISQKSSLHYRTEVSHGSMRPFGLTAIRIGGQARIAVDAHRDMTLLQVPLQGQFVSRDRRGDGLLYGAGLNAQLVDAHSPIDLEFEPATRMLIFNLNDSQIELIGGKAVVEQFTYKNRVIALDNAAGKAFYQLAQFVMREIEVDRAAFFNDGLANRLEDCLLLSLAAALEASPQPCVRSGPVPSYVQRAERFMADRLRDPLTLTDIVEAAGTSARTLHRTFRDVRGDTPLGVLKRMRLERVHAELVGGKCATGDITRVAMSWGFNHMSLFAADYRKQFGLAPSATVIQARRR